MNLYSLAFGCHWGPAHDGSYGFGNSFEEALENFKKAFPKQRTYPDCEGYGVTYDLNYEKN